MKKTVLKEFTLQDDGSIVLKAMKQYTDDDTGEVILETPHRVMIAPNMDYDEAMEATNAYLVQLGFPPLEASPVRKSITATYRADPEVQKKAAEYMKLFNKPVMGTK